jgi:type IV pilus assembly protein PilE
MVRKQGGFTLIEVMIVVTIIAILAAVAIPSYSDYVTRGRVVEAIAGLGDARTKMEQYFQDNRSYPTGCVVSPAVPGATQVQLSQLKNFNLVCGNLGANTYTVTANGVSSMVGFTYTVDQQNVRTSAFSGTGASKGWTAASPNTCWVIRKGGIC